MPSAVPSAAMLLLALMGDPVPKFSADAFCRGVAKLLHEPEYR